LNTQINIQNNIAFYDFFLFVTLPKQLKTIKMKEVAIGILTVTVGVALGMVISDVIKTKLMN
jgi:hypothetical protein